MRTTFTSASAALLTLALVGAVTCQSTEVPHVKLDITSWAEEGTDPTAFQKSVEILVRPNVTLYHALEHASWEDPENFSFEAIDHPEYGHYITCIGGRCEDIPNNIFWLIYKTAGVPDPNAVPTDSDMIPKGVDSTLVNEGEQYLFWLHKYEVVKK